MRRIFGCTLVQLFGCTLVQLFRCALALLLSSCSVMVKTPLNRFESPETRGKSGGVDGYLGYQGRNEIELTPSVSRRAPDLTHPSSETPGHRLMANASVGLAERFDMSLTLPEARLGAKYQLLGNPHESAEAGNIPLSISTSIAAVSEEETAYGTIKLKELVYDLALISGYRINAHWMIYECPLSLWDELKT